MIADAPVGQLGDRRDWPDAATDPGPEQIGDAIRVVLWLHDTAAPYPQILTPIVHTLRLLNERYDP